MGGWGKVKAGSRYGGVGERTFREWIKNGLKHSRLPTGTILVRYSDIDKFLESFAVTDDRVDQIVDEIVEGIQT